MSECTLLPEIRHANFISNINLLDAALGLAKEGYSLIPLHSIDPQGKCTCARSCSSPGKHPLTAKGSKDATNDLSSIHNWWIQKPYANIGIATGKEAGVVVLDVDLKSGGLESFNKLESKYGSLFEHRHAASGGGGKHIYFKAPEQLFRNRTSMLPGIDFRAEGGYIVAPPSKHVSGGGVTLGLMKKICSQCRNGCVRFCKKKLFL